MKSLTIVAGVSLMAASSFAQGTIALANTASELITYGSTSVKADSSVYGTVLQVYSYAATGATPTAFTLQDFLTKDAAYNAWSIDSLTTPGILPTVKSSGQITGNNGFTASNIAPGANVWLEILAVANGTPTLVQSINDSSITYGGVSAIWSQGTANPTTSPAGIPVSTAGLYVGGITLTPVPEPTTIALAGLGAASLLLFRRRK